MTLESEEKRTANIGELSRLAVLGIQMGFAYIGLKPLLTAHPEHIDEGIGGFIVNDAFPLVDAVSWPVVGVALAIGALAWETMRRVPRQVGIPKIVPGSWKVPIGKTYRGKWVFHDFSGVVPHVIVAGSTKFGKTAFMKTALYVLCQQQSAERLQILIIDLKGGASFGRFRHLPHVLDVKRTVEEAEEVLAAAESEMWRRLDLLDRERMKFREDPDFPHLLVLVDEGSLLKLSDECMRHLQNISAIGRESRVNLCYGTQRPSHDILPVTIRDQMEGRFVFHLNEPGSSGVVLGEGNKEAHEMPKRPGRMIYRSVDGDVYLQAAYVPEKEIERWLKTHANLIDSGPVDEVTQPGDIGVTSSGMDTTAFEGA